MSVSAAPPSDGWRAEHWDAAYRTRGVTGVSWYQPTAATSIDLIERLGVSKSAAIIDIGGGASVLADALLARGFCDVSVLDVSKVALEEVRRRLGANTSLSLLQADILAWKPGRRYDLWHDRAVFHFLVEKGDRERYIQSLWSALHDHGLVIVATFAPDGPEYCSGLPVTRHAAADLDEILGPEFAVVEAFRDIHVTPSGISQPFTWMAARRGTTGDA